MGSLFASGIGDLWLYDGEFTQPIQLGDYRQSHWPDHERMVAQVNWPLGNGRFP